MYLSGIMQYVIQLQIVSIRTEDEEIKDLCD